MYILSHFSAIMSEKMWFMNTWNVGGALQKLKNMMVGSKRLKGVMNTAFH